MKFQFDNKQPERVTFQKEGHKYTGKGGRKYTSVTTLLANYYEPFDTDYWSTYKAVKDVMSNAGIWHRYKEASGGWEGVVNHYRLHKGNLDFTLQQQIKIRIKHYVDLWDAEREYAAKKGNEAHDELEGLVLSHKKIDLGDRGIADVSAADLLDLQGFNRGHNGVYPELLLWNERFRLAGQADLVERYGKQVHIKDYKTCKKIEMEPFMDKHMLEPLHHLPDMNYSKFTMQLSTYGWMLEQIGFEVTGLTMIHINRETREHIQDYPLAYRKDLVIKMLEDHDSKRIRKSA